MNGPQRPLPVVIDENHAKTGTKEGTEHTLPPQLVKLALQIRQFSVDSLFFPSSRR
jgi:hypothetical protein